MTFNGEVSKACEVCDVHISGRGVHSKGKDLVNVSVSTRMLGQVVVKLLLCSAVVVSGQNDGSIRYPAPDYKCPEVNGRFPDPEQCDLYYICRKDSAEAVLCPEGLLFDFSIPNREKCVLPHNVKCGDRVLIQERTPGIDPRCEAANGIFNFDDPAVCDKYINCDQGRAFEMPCPAPLVFDITLGTCTRPEQLSEQARRCDEDQEFLEIDGFRCPGGEKVGPQGLLQAHPIYPHPTDCRSYFTCYFGKVILHNISIYSKNINS